MNICDLIYESDKIAEYVKAKMSSGMTEGDAIDKLVDEVIAQTKKESDEGILHGYVESSTATPNKRTQ